MNKSNVVKSNMLKMFLEAVEAVGPGRLVAENLKLSGTQMKVCNKIYELKDGSVYVVGFGKAVMGMARETERILGRRLKRGVISVPVGTPIGPLEQDSPVEVLVGAKDNLPDEAAENAADKIIELVSSISNQNDKLIVLISGGGSALFPKPKPGITLEGKLKIIKWLTSSGASINELNVVRKKLSKVKGGGLANLSYPTQTISLILSDVLNDPLDIIASGPTVPNQDSDEAAFDVIKKYNLINSIPQSAMKVITNSKCSNDLPVVSNCFPHADNYLIGNNIKALNAAMGCAEALGFKSVILSHLIDGNIDDIAEFYKNIFTHIINYVEKQNEQEFLSRLQNLLKNQSFTCDDMFTHTLTAHLKANFFDVKKLCLIAGGETTVKLKGNGKGGRNQELALIFLTRICELKSEYKEFFDKYDVMFLSAGTDGIDGPTDVAGAIVDDKVFQEAKRQSININEFLEKNNSYNFFTKINNGSYLIKTGHTGTNVADIHLLVMYENNHNCITVNNDS